MRKPSGFTPSTSPTQNPLLPWPGQVGGLHEAQDLVQAVFLAAGQKAATLQTHPNPLGWLLQALQYELSHTFSKRARRAGREVP